MNTKMSLKFFFVMGLITQGVMVSTYAADKNDLELEAQKETFLKSEDSNSSKMYKFNISLDTAGLTDDEAKTRLLGMVDELNVQAFHAFGTNDNHFRIQYPVSGIQVKSYGRDTTAVLAGGITLIGIGGRTTFPLIKTSNGIIKISIDADIVSQYILGSTDIAYDCPTCTTNLDYVGDYTNPRALDFVTQTKINLELNYDKFTVSAQYNKSYGTGGGTAPWANSKQYPSSGYVPVEFKNTMESESLGLRLDYKVNKKWSLYAGISKNKTSVSESISESNLNGTASVVELGTVTYSDGTIVQQNVTRTINVHEEGAKQKNNDFLNYSQFNMGFKYRF